MRMFDLVRDSLHRMMLTQRGTSYFSEVLLGLKTLRGELGCGNRLFTMSFDRQLIILVAALTGLVTFVACTLSFGLPVWTSVLIASVVLLAGLLFGRDISELIQSLLH
jgi:hypothetical protein